MINKLLTSAVWISVGLSLGFWITHAASPSISTPGRDRPAPTRVVENIQTRGGLTLLQPKSTPSAVKTLPAIAVLATIAKDSGAGIIQISINNGPIETVRVGDMVTEELKLVKVTPTEVQLNYASDDSTAKVIALPPLPKLPEAEAPPGRQAIGKNQFKTNKDSARKSDVGS
jgi:hypothetical protein